MHLVRYEFNAPFFASTLSRSNLLGQDYKRIANELETAIRAGELPAGHKLLPQREFAWRRKLATSTASRVYAELRRRGLVNGEVGRGTYVLSSTERASRTLPEEFVDLEKNFPITAEQGRLISRSLSVMMTPSAMARAVGAPPSTLLSHAQDVSARFLSRPGWSPDPRNIFFAGNGREALAAALALIARPGDRVGIEAISYTMMRDIAPRAGVELVPLELDEDGLVPGAIVKANRDVGLQAIYLQPSLHNPLGMTMSDARRRAIAEVLEQEGLIAVEDAVNSFFIEATPLAALAPSRVLLVESLSKRLAPSLTVGFLVVPERLRGGAAGAVRAAVWSAAGLVLSAAVKLMKDGTATELEAVKRVDAAERHHLALSALEGLEVRSDPRAYHLWVELPKPWRAEAFVAAAAGLGIAITPGQAFTFGPGHGPNAIRLTTGTPTREVLAGALEDLRRLALSPPEAIVA